MSSQNGQQAAYLFLGVPSTNLLRRLFLCVYESGNGFETYKLNIVTSFATWHAMLQIVVYQQADVVAKRKDALIRPALATEQTHLTPLFQI